MLKKSGRNFESKIVERLERDREIVINFDSSRLSAVRSVDVGKLLNHVKIFGVVLYSLLLSYYLCCVFCFRFV